MAHDDAADGPCGYLVDQGANGSFIFDREAVVERNRWGAVAAEQAEKYLFGAELLGLVIVQKISGYQGAGGAVEQDGFVQFVAHETVMLDCCAQIAHHFRIVDCADLIGETFGDNNAGVWVGLDAIAQVHVVEQVRGEDGFDLADLADLTDVFRA